MRNEGHKRRNLIIGAGLAALSLSVAAEASGDAPVRVPAHLNLDFKPVVVSGDKPNRDTVIKTERRTIVFPQPTPVLSSEPSLSPDELKIQKLQNETADYVRIARESGKFSDNWINSLKMYGPIYIAVAGKFEKSGIDWKMLWITHELESGASAKDSKAFDGSTYPYVGGMQRNELIWSDEFVKAAFSSLDYLNSISTNHQGDASEIAGAAGIMAPNMEQYGPLGKQKAVFNAFSLFTGSVGLAQQRLDVWITAENVFPDTENAAQ